MLSKTFLNCVIIVLFRIDQSKACFIFRNFSISRYYSIQKDDNIQFPIIQISIQKWNKSSDLFSYSFFMTEGNHFDQNEVQQILLNHGYEFVDVVGKGGYGMALKVFSLKYKTHFVAKAIYLNVENGHKLKRSFENEVDIISHLEHPNIIKIYDSFIDSDYCVQILEWCENGSLSSLLKIATEFQPSEITFFIRPIIEALHYLHSKDIAHCDIKPSNILLGSYNRPILADFGISRYLDNENGERHMGGSVPYMAPEMSNTLHYDPKKCDIWALGVTIYELSTGELPYKPCYNRINQVGLLQCPQTMDPDVSQVIYRTLKMSPKMRISAHQLLSLPLFQRNQTMMNSKPGQLPKSGKFIESVQSIRFYPKRTSLPIVANNRRIILNSQSLKFGPLPPKSISHGNCKKIESDDEPVNLGKFHFPSLYKIPQSPMAKPQQFFHNPF